MLRLIHLNCPKWLPLGSRLNEYMGKITLLRIALLGGAVFYFIGGIAHFFGLTLFPWYAGSLYSPYHDTVIALTAFVLGLIILTVSKDPIKNIDILNILMVGCFLAILFSVYIIFKIDFAGPTELKKTETIVELVLLILYLTVLIALKPDTKKTKNLFPEL